jgi:hypothetical protein
MAKRYWRRRTIIIAAAIVVLSIGIVFASIPYLPRHPNTIASPTSFTVAGGSSTYPGYHGLLIGSISNGEYYAVGVNANETATFCVMPHSSFLAWTTGNSKAWATFPWSDCILKQQTTQSTLAFTATMDGSWDVAALNTNPTPISVQFTPAQ